MSGKKPLQLILFKRRGKFFFAACRGEQRGCNVKPKERSKLGPCEHCVVIHDETKTVAEVMAELERGDA